MIAAKGAGETRAPFFMPAIRTLRRKETRMHPPELGRLERIDLETLWEDEPSGFAPWFADPERLRILDDALGLRLAPVAGTLEAGPDRAGFLCRDAVTGAAVAVGAQLGESDRACLGALLARAEAAGAPAAVWLAERLSPEHRAVIHALNRIGRGADGYFGVEMGLWRIDDSPAAPGFAAVAEPAGWPLPAARPRRGRYPCRAIGLRWPGAGRYPTKPDALDCIAIGD